MAVTTTAVDGSEDAAEPTLVVVGLPLQRAATYDVGDKTVADYNPNYPAEDHAIEVAYPDRTDVYLEEQQTYAFPRSRLKLQTPVHDRDGDDGQDTDAERAEPSRSEPADFGGGESTGVQDL